MTSIYALQDPRDGALRYVGQTKKKLSERLIGHLCIKPFFSDLKKDRWIRELAKAGLEPQIVPLESVRDEDADQAEAHWYETLRNRGCQLLNAKVLELAL